MLPLVLVPWAARGPTTQGTRLWSLSPRTAPSARFLPTSASIPRFLSFAYSLCSLLTLRLLLVPRSAPHQLANVTARAGSAHGVRALAAAGVNAKAVDQVRANNDAASDAVAASLARLATSQEAFETVDVQHKQAMASHKTAIDAAGLSLNNSKFAAAEDARDILDTAEATRSTVAQQAGLARNRSVALCAEQHQGRAAADAARHASVEKLSKLVNQFRACSNNEKKVVEEKAEVKEESVAAEKAVEAQAATAVKAEAAEEKTDAFLQVRTNLRRARVSVRQASATTSPDMRFVFGSESQWARPSSPGRAVGASTIEDMGAFEGVGVTQPAGGAQRRSVRAFPTQTAVCGVTPTFDGPARQSRRPRAAVPPSSVGRFGTTLRACQKSHSSQNSRVPKARTKDSKPLWPT